MSGPISLSFSHFGFFVSDLEKMKLFYSEVMGFFITDEGQFPNGQSLVFLSRDPTEHHQLVLIAGCPEDNSFNRINQISFFVKDLEELRSFFFAIENETVTDLQAITHGNAWSIYFRDPEGNRIEVYTHTPWYVSQPLREPIDLRLEVEAIHKHTEDLCRTLPGFQSRDNWLQTMKTLMHPEQDK
jgi:catechol 2,3-dioxygenase